MKKLSLILASMVLFAGMSFAQTATGSTPAKTTTKSTDKKGGAKKGDKKADKKSSSTSTPAAK